MIHVTKKKGSILLRLVTVSYKEVSKSATWTALRVTRDLVPRKFVLANMGEEMYTFVSFFRQRS